MTDRSAVLSNDDLQHILSYLTSPDLASADMISYRWQQVSRVAKLWKQLLATDYPSAAKLPSNDPRSLYISMIPPPAPPLIPPVPLDGISLLLEMHRTNGERISLALPFSERCTEETGGDLCWSGIGDVSLDPNSIRIDCVRCWRASDNKVCVFLDSGYNGTGQDTGWQYVDGEDSIGDAGYFISPGISRELRHHDRFTAFWSQLNLGFSHTRGGLVTLRYNLSWALGPIRESSFMSAGEMLRCFLLPAVCWQ